MSTRLWIEGSVLNHSPSHPLACEVTSVVSESHALHAWVSASRTVLLVTEEFVKHSMLCRSAEPKQKQAAQLEQEAPKVVAPSQPSRAPSAQAAPQPVQAAQATPQPTPEAPQSADAAAPVKREGAALLLCAHFD